MAFQGGEWNDYSAGSLIWNDSNDVHATRVYDEPLSQFFPGRVISVRPAKSFCARIGKVGTGGERLKGTRRCRGECLISAALAPGSHDPAPASPRTRAFSRCRILGPDTTAAISSVKSRSASNLPSVAGFHPAGVIDLLINVHHFAMIVWVGTQNIHSWSTLIVCHTTVLSLSLRPSSNRSLMGRPWTPATPMEMASLEKPPPKPCIWILVMH